MNISDEEEFVPDKLRSNVERLYMTVVRCFSERLDAKSLTVLGHRPNSFRKAHRSHSLVAGDSAHWVVLCGVLRRVVP